MVELQLGTYIKVLQTNGRGEFKAFHIFLQSCGILHCTSCPHVHEQNGLAERKHRHIVEVGLILLTQSHLPLKLWDHYFITIVYTINRLPTPVFHSKTPFEALFHHKSSYSHFRVFGCRCYPHIRSYNTHKFSFHSTPSIFLGLP